MDGSIEPVNPNAARNGIEINAGKVPVGPSKIITPITISALLWLIYKTLLLLWGLPVWIVWLVLLFRQSIRAGLLAVVLSPYFISPLYFGATAAIGYFQGSARILTVGLLWENRIDPAVRCWLYSPTCFVYGNEAFWLTPNNATLYALASIFGPMPGGYGGPYPTIEETAILYKGSEPATVKLHEEEDRQTILTIEYKETAVNIPSYAENHYERGLRSDWMIKEVFLQSSRKKDFTIEYRASVIDGRCLVIFADAKPASENNDIKPWRNVYLIDLETGTPFRTYNQIETLQPSPI